MSKKKKPKKAEAPKKTKVINEEEEPTKDFGGFPDRDLKKNLGSG